MVPFRLRPPPEGHPHFCSVAHPCRATHRENLPPPARFFSRENPAQQLRSPLRPGRLSGRAPLRFRGGRLHPGETLASFAGAAPTNGPGGRVVLAPVESG